jgi:hypothetical protein
MEGNDEYEIESGTRSRCRGRSRTRNDDRQGERERFHAVRTADLRPRSRSLMKMREKESCLESSRDWKIECKK